MIHFLTAHGIWIWLTAVSLLTFTGTLIIVPWLVIRMPADYFTHHFRREVGRPGDHPAVRLILLILKNMLGVILVGAGVVMLFIPGQGLLTIIIGMGLLDFPGKYSAERWFVSCGPVLHSINRIRKRAGKPPLAL